MSAPPIPLKTRKVVWERSGLVCEICSAARAVHIHHRKLRSQGGTNDFTNLLHICTSCHMRAHANRDGKSYARGWLVRRADDPADVPVERAA